MESIRLALAGDVMLGRLTDHALRQRGLNYPWGNVLPRLKAADLTVVNLECVVSRSGRPWSRWSKTFHFRAAPHAIHALRLAGIDAVTLANNHVLDYEEPALLEMLTSLSRADIAFAGAGRNLEEARRPAFLEARGLRLAIVAFTDNEPGWAATATSPGTNWLEVSLGEESLAIVRQSIAAARQGGADAVLVSNHWGPNMVERPSALFRQFAHAVIDAGADIYFGHSSHLFQGVELYRGRPIIYDAGDFVDDYAVDPELRNDRGLLFELSLGRHGVRRIGLSPTIIDDCQVNLAEGEERQAIARRIAALSMEFGTVVQSAGDRWWIDCEASQPQAAVTATS
ncbi:MAG TPA: CapA family protein [Pirellulales bacterium]|nr:CapA family protein [Pirellulales bacterium]